MVDFDKVILTELVKAIRKIVGVYLSDLATPTTNPPTLPAVIKAQTLDDVTAPIPDYPYITVDIGGLVDDGQWLMSEGIFDDSGEYKYYYEKYQMFRIEVMCYGTNSFGILRELKNSFVSDQIRHNIFENPIRTALNTAAGKEVFEIAFHRSTEVNRIPTLEPTKYLNGSMFSFDYTLSEYILDGSVPTNYAPTSDTNTGIFDTIQGAGQYKYDKTTTDNYTDNVDVGPL